MEQNSPSFSYCRCSMKHIFEVQLHCMRMRFFRFSYGNCINSWLFFSLSLLTEQQLSIFLLMFENKFRPNFCIQIHKISWKFPYKNACKRFYLPFLWIFRGCSVQMTKIFFRVFVFVSTWEGATQGCAHACAFNLCFHFVYRF